MVLLARRFFVKPACAWAYQARQLRQHVFLVLFLCAALLNQTLGLVHGVVHLHQGEGQPSIHAHAHIHTDSHAGEEPCDEDGHGFLSRLFGGHTSDTDCRLYDQSSHVDDMPGTPSLVLPLVMGVFVFSVFAGLALARWHTQFQARGPP